MLRRVGWLFLFVVGWAPAMAAGVWPEQLWEHKRLNAAHVPMADADKLLWNEYGWEASEKAYYQGPGGSYTAVGHRLKDPTSAWGVFLWLKPAGLGPSRLMESALEGPSRLYLVMGNYVLDFQGKTPTQQELGVLFLQLPRLDQSPFPSLGRFLPAEGLRPLSERFVIGPTTLERFLPEIPVRVAAFSLGAEAQVAEYGSGRPIRLGMFSYPTPQIARERVEEMQKLPGVVARRISSLVVTAAGGGSRDDAERLVARVNYRQNITWNQAPSDPDLSPVDLLLTIAKALGLIAGFAILAGVGYAGIRRLARKVTGEKDDQPMVTLHLD